ncbi:hypothetical protein B0H12DRAFT_1103511 [Mycena haematopus]|nr:hypothetical protein B0H12DRAFT_1103511 [Mycena haematopus]
MLSNLASDRARIAYLDFHITALENSLVVLKNERQSVQAQLDAYVYPICTLPNEVVSQIFVLTLPPYPSSSPLWGPSSPTLLGQIFQKWRDIAFSTPMLWRAPSFVASRLWTPLQFHRARERGIELFETWIARSGSCPLSIQLKDARSSVIPVDLDRFSEIIVCHLARIEHLEMSTGDEMDLSKPASMPETMPLLRTLKLGSWSIEDSIPVARFLNAPRLRSVHITRSSCASEILLPWNRTDDYRLGGRIPNFGLKKNLSGLWVSRRSKILSGFLLRPGPNFLVVGTLDQTSEFFSKNAQKWRKIQINYSSTQSSSVRSRI